MKGEAPMLALVVTADDLGIDARRDDGIFEALEKGAVTQSSLMVRGPSAVQAAARARRSKHTLGLHLDLTESDPCAPADQVRSLLDSNGKKLGKHGLRAAIANGTVDLEHVARETRAQIALFAELVGEKPRHVDGHQHAHIIPALAETLARVFQEQGVGSTRIPEQREVRGDGSDAHRFYREVSRSASEVRQTYTRHQVASTATFVGLDLMGDNSSAQGLAAAARAALSTGSVEIMCHPGYVGAGWDDFNKSNAREHELGVLLSFPFAPLVKEGLAQLTTFTAAREKGQLT